MHLKKETITSQSSDISGPVRYEEEGPIEWEFEIERTFIWSEEEQDFTGHTSNVSATLLAVVN